MIKIGNIELENVFIGNNQCAAIYVGHTKIWPTVEEPDSRIQLETPQIELTFFDEENPAIIMRNAVPNADKYIGKASYLGIPDITFELEYWEYDSGIASIIDLQNLGIPDGAVITVIAKSNNTSEYKDSDPSNEIIFRSTDYTEEDDDPTTPPYNVVINIDNASKNHSGDLQIIIWNDDDIAEFDSAFLRDSRKAFLEIPENCTLYFEGSSDDGYIIKDIDENMDCTAVNYGWITSSRVINLRAYPSD